MNLPAPASVDLVYFNAGGGHRATALALQDAIASLGWPWTVRLVNLFELLDPNDAFRRVTGRAPETVYNQRLARGWTLGLAQELKLLQAAIRYAHPTLLHYIHGMRCLVSTLSRATYPFERCEEFAPNGESLEVQIPGISQAKLRTGCHLAERFADFLPFEKFSLNASLGEGNTPLVRPDRRLCALVRVRKVFLRNETQNLAPIKYNTTGIY